MVALSQATLGRGSATLKVAKQGFGAMSVTKGFYADPPPEEVGIETVQAALKGGVNVIATAAFYGDGANETLLGKAIQGFKREDVCICSKWGPRFPEGAAPSFNPGRAEAFKTIDESLQHLGVDFIDVWILRAQGKLDKAVLQETFQAVKELMDAGKVKHCGACEMAPEDIRAAHAIVPITLCELEWSLFARDCEQELVPTLRELGIGVLAYSPMGKGLLTGQLDLSKLDPKDFRVGFAGDDTYYSPGKAAQNAKMAAKVAELAKAKGCTAAQLALAWVHHRGNDVVPIPGTKSPRRVPENLAAASLQLSAQDLADLEAAVPFDQVSGGRYKGNHGTFTSSH